MMLLKSGNLQSLFILIMTSKQKIWNLNSEMGYVAQKTSKTDGHLSVHIEASLIF